MKLDIEDAGFCVDCWIAIDKVTQNGKNNVYKFEMDNKEWVIAAQLRDVLKVCFNHDLTCYLT